MCSSSPKSTFPQRNKQKSFQCEIRAVLTLTLVDENNDKYGGTPMHIIMHNL